MIYRQPPAAIPAIWVARKSADTGFAAGGCVAPEANLEEGGNGQIKSRAFSSSALGRLDEKGWE